MYWKHMMFLLYTHSVKLHIVFAFKIISDVFDLLIHDGLCDMVH